MEQYLGFQGLVSLGPGFSIQGHWFSIQVPGIITRWSSIQVSRVQYLGSRVQYLGTRNYNTRVQYLNYQGLVSCKQDFVFRLRGFRIQDTLQFGFQDTWVQYHWVQSLVPRLSGFSIQVTRVQYLDYQDYYIGYQGLVSKLP